MSDSTNHNPIGTLLRVAVDIADGSTDLGERRLALIKQLALLTESDFVHWAWLRARPESNRILPVGFIHSGYTESQLADFLQYSLDPEVQKELHEGLRGFLESSTRADGVWCAIPRDGTPSIDRYPNRISSQRMVKIGVGQWMQAGRHIPDNMTTLTLGRRPGNAEYGDAERDLVDLAFSNIPWLWASPDERVSCDEVEALTSRQRAVAFLLLDGLSRKKIASRLGISEETVNHHTKLVFRHFNVQSATELAALFLRSQ